MADLIDRNAVLAEIGEFQIRFNETGDSHERVAYATAEHCMLVIKAAPTIEAEPVRHGQWIVHTTWQGMFGLIHSECSECKFDRNGDLSSWKFCPNCGAKMDGGADNDG